MTKFEIWEMLGGLVWLAAFYLMWMGVGAAILSGLMHLLGAPGK